VGCVGEVSFRFTVRALVPPRTLAVSAASAGLSLRSYRIPGGLEASIELDPKYCAFPGGLCFLFALCINSQVSF